MVGAEVNWNNDERSVEIVSSDFDESGNESTINDNTTYYTLVEGAAKFNLDIYKFHYNIDNETFKYDGYDKIIKVENKYSSDVIAYINSQGKVEVSEEIFLEMQESESN
ncbi:hypothetical protein [Paenibacillus sp. HB172176]|uniref:hypothetical protein n=1 Tax=Paenibacillus sp. HB172176 TaxID=2493690 RepID=UPI00143C491D|nr:hypothetical protein [Paenibacillus sp. HB172176]